MNEPLQWQAMGITVHIYANTKSPGLSYRGRERKKTDYVLRNFMKYNPL